MIEYGHYVGGKHVAGGSGRMADVFQPMDGTVRASVALASKAEVDAAVANAKAAQPAWGATNPQRRARVLMKFYDLIAQHNDELAEILAREHGKTIPDAKGDIQRGVEVLEFSFDAPHLLKGEYTDGAGPGIDLYSMRQPLGVVAGITPFNFPAMIPLVEARAGNRLRQRFHPEALGARSRRADAARRTVRRGGRPSGRSQRGQRRQGSGRRHPRRSRHPG